MNAEDSKPFDSTATGHEPIGVSVRFVVLSVTGLVTLILLTLWGMSGAARLLSSGEEGLPEGARQATSARTVGLGLNQTAQREAIVAQQEKWLSEYRWLDQDQQTARIPIDRAMEIMAERGIGFAPARHTEPALTQDPPAPSNEDQP